MPHLRERDNNHSTPGYTGLYEHHFELRKLVRVFSMRESPTQQLMLSLAYPLAAIDCDGRAHPGELLIPPSNVWLRLANLWSRGFKKQHKLIIRETEAGKALSILSTDAKAAFLPL